MLSWRSKLLAVIWKEQREHTHPINSRAWLISGKKRAVPLFPCSFVKTHPWLEHYLESDSPKPKEVNGISLASCKNSDCIICTRKSHWNFLSNHLTLKCNTNSTGLMKSIRPRLEVAPSQKQMLLSNQICLIAYCICKNWLVWWPYRKGATHN